MAMAMVMAMAMAMVRFLRVYSFNPSAFSNMSRDRKHFKGVSVNRPATGWHVQPCPACHCKYQRLMLRTRGQSACFAQ